MEEWCGNESIDAGEVCDGKALGGATCKSQGFALGNLGCAADCAGFDVSDCVGSSGASDSQTAKWSPNFLDPTLNNYRQSQQGDIPPTALPDITTDTVMCSLMGDSAELSAEVCNRGIKTVGAWLKTAFYEGAPKDGKVLCVAVTVDALESEQCAVVSCIHDGAIVGDVSVVGNDDGMGGKTTLECIYTNNDDAAMPIECK